MKRESHLPSIPPPASHLGLRLLALLGVWVLTALPTLADPADGSGAAPRRVEVGRDHNAVRDSLRVEARRYSRIAAALRDSVAHLDHGQATAARKREIEATIDELTSSLGQISQELEGLEIQLTDKAIRLRDEHGGSVSIEIPDHLDENVARGLGTLTRVILDELPDSIRTALPRELDELRNVPAPPDPPRGGERADRPAPTTPPNVAWSRIFGGDLLHKTRIVEGDIVKIRDDAIVKPNEVVRGNVVAVMGDALVEGQVEGNVVVVLGDMQLGEDAQVGGRVISVLGRLDRDQDAEVGSIAVINPGSFTDLDAGDLIAGKGTWFSFVAAQVLLLLVVLLVIILMVSVPQGRLETASAMLARRPLECFGLGLLVAIGGHVILAAVLGILVLTIIGIPVALLVLLGLVLLDLLAVGIVCLNLGRRLCHKFSLACSRLWAMAILGMLVVHVPNFLSALLAWQGGAAPVAAALFVLGATLKVLVYCLGLGSLVASRFGTREPATVGEGLEPLPTR
jgi:hypothetical protein